MIKKGEHFTQTAQQQPSSSSSSAEGSTVVAVGVVASSDTMPMNETMKKDNTANMAAFKLMLLVLMVLQNSSTVLVGRYTRSNGSKESLFVVNHLVMITEVGKLLISCVFEYLATNGGLFKSIKENNIDRPMDCLKIAVPALLYLIQNTLLYIALSNLSAPFFQVTYQAKLVTTAIVSVLMLGRSYSPKQWLCLVGLSAGVAIVVLGESQDKSSTTSSTDETKPVQSLMVGLVAVTIACFCSALAGVYFEKVLKVATTDKDGSARAPVSVWMRNFQLSFFSVIIALLQNAGTPTPAGEEPKAYLHGFTPLVWVLVVLQAGGGLLVAAVIKYADNVLKGLATGVSVVAATVFSMIIFGTPLSNQFSMGAVLILLSVYFFANDLPAMCLPKVKREDDEMEAMLPSK